MLSCSISLVFQDKLSFWFATGGAGFCLSRSLALRMRPFAARGKFKQVGDKIRLPDDVTMGYLAEHVLGTPLTVVEEFHSHLEPLRFMAGHAAGRRAGRGIDLENQISFSYGSYGQEPNVVPVEGFGDEEDPTR